ncbi:GH92 family glycosyl hydrolase [Agaribacter flavus]|uniref:GH92 family glycosyl hydrolase n=2 Tax=Agaribacter flavus TaxID=1902781 RepID=A0ABV7FNW8_9ALTE
MYANKRVFWRQNKAKLFLLIVGFVSFNLCLHAQSDEQVSEHKGTERVSLTQYVNPFIGTSNFGATHPGAQYPHGMASVVPFNVAFGKEEGNIFEKDESWHSRPYVHENTFLTGFSHVNLSGVGCPELGALLLMPTSGELELDPQKYGSTYTKEVASPGYYSSHLNKYNIRTEVTSTPRSGISRYHFPAGKNHIIFNLGLSLSNETGAMVKRVSDTEIEGFRTIGTFCYRPEDIRPVYFVAQVSQSPSASGVYKKMPEYKNVEAEWVKFNNSYKTYDNYFQAMAGDDVGAYFTFQHEQATSIEVKVGISYVSIENARANLEAEQPKFNFDRTLEQSTAAWNKLLSRVKVKGTVLNKRLFYTALYHMLIHPNLLQDVNGEYPIMGSHRIGNTQGKDRYTTFSLWDTNRNVHPFLSLVYPELQSAMVNSMVDMAKESGWMPKWELLSMETDVMVGDPAAIVIADTYLKGITDFDVMSAYSYLKKGSDTSQNNPLRPESVDYNSLAYVPIDDEGSWDGSVSTSLEYYLADFAISQLANALGKPDDSKRYYQKSLGYKHLLDPETGMLRPKFRSGEWFTPYNPELGRNFEPAPGYVEGNAWNYRFYVPHDVPGLIEALGGSDIFLAELQRCFETNNYDMANEPDITYPFLFNYVEGSAWKSQKKVKQLINKYYADKPSGLPGNDDAGTMSAWLAFSMLGLYPVTPASTEYAIVTPQFEHIEISLSDKYYEGNTLVIESSSQQKDEPFIESVHLNSTKIDSFFVDHTQLVKGGTLRFQLQSTPNTSVTEH